MCPYCNTRRIGELFVNLNRKKGVAKTCGDAGCIKSHRNYLQSTYIKYSYSYTRRKKELQNVKQFQTCLRCDCKIPKSKIYRLCAVCRNQNQNGIWDVIPEFTVQEASNINRVHRQVCAKAYPQLTGRGRFIGLSASNRSKK